MSKAYFISDVHLGLESAEQERAKESRLLAFLDFMAEDASSLFIVGDLFDAWIEYRTVIPKGYHRTLAKLDEIVTRGIDVHYLAGNHDFWMREFFHDSLGMKTHRDAFSIVVNKKNIFLHHGDGLANNDLGYRIVKKVLRNRMSIWLFSWLHPDLGIRLAQSSSKTSRSYTQDKDYGPVDGMEEFAKQKISEGYDIVVMGHRHHPAFTRIGNGVYINLGDWITSNTYAVLQDGDIQLREWS
ncbi:MAG TPA: UDP-2,3-diacylglucosamine diphosphatase [Bacteroidota bacterium]|nr:UDP-2,3-diacylglucosamine diphosphatase [Bacteroidota bacterium]